MDVFQMAPRCLEHDTALQPRTRNGRVGKPLWALINESTSAYTYDLYQMFCPLNSHGGNDCCESWRMVELSFTLLPHGLLRPTERRYHHGVRQLGESAGDGSAVPVGADEEGLLAGGGNGHELPVAVASSADTGEVDLSALDTVLVRQEDQGTVVLDSEREG